ncbi:MAG TPA: outer membrane beta-barrel protein [Fluviicola sp.]|nr:outer membrane beta-barrel protein [Fluviicola sp.]
MKKLLLSLVCAGFALSLTAQEEVATKKVQMGLAYQLGLNYNKPGTKNIERLGVGVQNSIGMNVNFSFTQNIGLSTGLEFDFESFKYDVVAADKVYYYYVDSKIIKKEDLSSNPDAKLYNLQERKQKAIYGTIPTMLLFRTNMIGDFRYYGKFGARTSFVLSNTINDKGFNMTGDSLMGTPVASDNSNMKAKGDMFFMRSTIGLAAGAEWNFTGSTSLFAELGFYYGLTPVHFGEAIGGDDKERDMTMFQRINGANDYLTFAAKQKQIVLKIGILF